MVRTRERKRLRRDGGADVTAVHTDNVFAATDPRDERARNVLAQAIRERDEARAALARGPLTDDEIERMALGAALMTGTRGDETLAHAKRRAWIGAYRAAHAKAAEVRRDG